MGRILALDFGFKRTGIAVTDPLKIIANPLTTVQTEKLMEFLVSYRQREEVEVIIVGKPVNLDNTSTHTTESAMKLVDTLKQTFPDVEVDMVDERFTSRMAMDAMIASGTKKKDRRKKENIDKVSAVIILQSYLQQKGY